MKLKIKSSILALGALAVASFTIWPGCASMPLDSKRQSLSNLQARDFAFEQESPTTREEIFARLGQPDECFYFSDCKVACYKLERLTRHRVDLLLLILPIGYHKDIDRLQVAFLLFDDHDRLSRSELKVIPNNPSRKQLLNFAAQWSKKPYAIRDFSDEIEPRTWKPQPWKPRNE